MLYIAKTLFLKRGPGRAKEEAWLVESFSEVQASQYPASIVQGRAGSSVTCLVALELPAGDADAALPPVFAQPANPSARQHVRRLPGPQEVPVSSRG